MKVRVVSSGSASTHYGNKLEQWAVGSLALTVLICATIWAFLVPARVGIDDVGLFNPVYTFLTSGTVTYPSYGHFHQMVVHPPTHYFVLGVLAKIGIPMSYVPSIPPYALLLLTVYLVWVSKFPVHAKLGLLFAPLVGTLFLSFTQVSSTAFGFGFRPDMHLTLAWYAGLISLESGRLDDWNPRRLFLGGLLLTYSATLHYWACLAWLGVLAYFIPLLRSRDFRHAAKPIGSMVAGSCIPGILYLLLFVIPKWSEILAFVRSAEPLGGLRGNIEAHIALCKQVYEGFVNQPVRFFFAPQRVGVLPVVISTSAFLLTPSLRFMALAGLPLQLFLLLAVGRKWNLYLNPEFTVYAAGLTVLVLWAIFAVANTLGRKISSALVLGMSLFLSLTLLLGTGWLSAATPLSRPRIFEHDVARAAGKQILGPNAFVGSRLSRFYTNGGSLSYMLDPDILWGRTFGLDIRQYFENFDAVAEDGHGSELTSNEMGQSLSSWYAEGTLSLRGFFFSTLNTHLSYLLLHPEWHGQRQGYALTGGRVAHFREDPSGLSVFVAARCQTALVSTFAPEVMFRNSYALPKIPGRTQEEFLETAVVPLNAYELLRQKLTDRCSIRDVIRLTREDSTVGDLLSVLREDKPITFVERLEDVVEARFGPSLGVTVTKDGWLDRASILRGRLKGHSYTLTTAGVRLLFRTDMDDDSQWELHRYGPTGGIEVQSDGMVALDNAGRYSTGDSKDHLSSPFTASAMDTTIAFFSVWVEPSSPDDITEFRLQNETFTFLSSARKVITRPDGWVLLAGWAEVPPQQRVRVVLTQRLGTASLFDKALLVSWPKLD